MGNGTRLELDFYIPDLRIAIEVQGSQHYEYIPHFHGDREGFRRQVERDDHKRSTCWRMGVRLIEVSQESDIGLSLTPLLGDAIHREPSLRPNAIASYLEAEIGILDREGQNCIRHLKKALRDKDIRRIGFLKGKLYDRWFKPNGITRLEFKVFVEHLP